MTGILARMPKAELHVHLEGTIAPETLWAMAVRNHVALPVGSLDELRGLYAFERFEKFLSLWMAMCACLRRPEDYEQMTDAFLEGCEAQNVRYVEAHFTPYNHERLGFGGRRALHGVRAVEDEATVRLLAERDVCCDVALTSNRFLTVYRDLSGHPLRRMMAAGVPVTLNGLRYGLAETGRRRRLMREFEAAGVALGL